MEKTRVDKWLWAIRIFKTRTIAGKACETGKVKRGTMKLKASSKVEINDKLEVKVNDVKRILKVLKLIDKRVGAPIAVTCYEELTAPEEFEKRKLKSAFLMPHAIRDKGAGRPTKKDRRDIDKLNDFDNEI